MVWEFQKGSHQHRPKASQSKSLALLIDRVDDTPSKEKPPKKCRRAETADACYLKAEELFLGRRFGGL